MLSIYLLINLNLTAYTLDQWKDQSYETTCNFHCNNYCLYNTVPVSVLVAFVSTNIICINGTISFNVSYFCGLCSFECD